MSTGSGFSSGRPFTADSPPPAPPPGPAPCGGAFSAPPPNPWPPILARRPPLLLSFGMASQAEPPAPHPPVSDTETTRRVPTSDDLEGSTYLEIARQREGEEPAPSQPPAPAHPETVVVLDFGSQYSMLMARRIRDCNVYCELLPFDAPWERVQKLNPRAFVLSGGPASVYDENPPLAPAYVFASGLPGRGT